MTPQDNQLTKEKARDKDPEILSKWDDMINAACWAMLQDSRNLWGWKMKPTQKIYSFSNGHLNFKAEIHMFTVWYKKRFWSL